MIQIVPRCNVAVKVLLLEMSTLASTTVLVTGGSGYIGSYVILALLSQGYTVRTTVRSLSREASTRTALSNGGATASDLARLSFVAASLEHDEGWAEALKGCTYVQHVASPAPAELPKHEDDLIIPARDGTLRVLKNAAAAGVKRVVLTSSSGAIEYGHPPQKQHFTEEDWTILDGTRKVAPYLKSKTLAERAAWDFMASSKATSKMELVAINPVFVFGPVLGADFSGSVEVIKKLMDGSLPGCPDLFFDIVDVRDVASLHVLAMTKTEVAGQRYFAANSDQVTSMVQLGQIIRANRPKDAKKVPTIQIPNFLVHALSFFDKAVRVILPDLGQVRKASNKKACEAFGWQPRGTQESVLDTADSLVKHKII
ncbi:NADPH-dependent methylglyoxal reductase GRE2 [Lachnellula suecica]|uniref:NADPH-dependent methylglyoxal reductase GRE2 n=1 Tax=Lachnellula suecica TaxID=602035 RepID=A0A8T9CGI5_9HELO|nr:NADPH-dependent methylglyoxal reductase GRE2 [Lachnellula suecica]